MTLTTTDAGAVEVTTVEVVPANFGWTVICSRCGVIDLPPRSKPWACTKYQHVATYGELSDSYPGIRDRSLFVGVAFVCDVRGGSDYTQHSAEPLPIWESKQQAHEAKQQHYCTAVRS